MAFAVCYLVPLGGRGGGALGGIGGGTSGERRGSGGLISPVESGGLVRGGGTGTSSPRGGGGGGGLPYPGFATFGGRTGGFSGCRGSVTLLRRAD